MGLISLLRAAFFGHKAESESMQDMGRNSSVRDNRWLRVKNPSFYGKACCSPNERWVVGCNDSDGQGRGGYRDSGNGKVLLVDYENDTVVHELNSFARPMQAAVANNATYIVNDGGFGSALQGDLVAINIYGSRSYQRHYEANIFNIGLSDCGRYAAVQTANAPNPDGNLFEVLNIECGIPMFSLPPKTGWADRYTFSVDAEGKLTSVGVVHKTLGQFLYSSDGTFLDGSKFDDARLADGDYSTKIMAARELLQSSPTPENAKRALTSSYAALNEGARETPDWEAQAYRVCGESHEVLGQLPEALKAYDHALRLNPKVGVQRRAVALRKKLGVNLT